MFLPLPSFDGGREVASAGDAPDEFDDDFTDGEITLVDVVDAEDLNL